MTSQKQILLAEDEENITFSLNYLLERAGYDVHCVDDGAHVETMMRSIRPELLILDIMLPNKSGFDVLSALRGRKEFVNTPVLILSAKGQKKDIERAMSLGATDYFTKPFSNREILARIGEMIDGQPK